ncbi:MAG: hypothetical protein ACOZNI_09835 [Myxococcota bacterium]
MKKKTKFRGLGASKAKPTETRTLPGATASAKRSTDVTGIADSRIRTRTVDRSLAGATGLRERTIRGLLESAAEGGPIESRIKKSEDVPSSDWSAGTKGREGSPDTGYLMGDDGPDYEDDFLLDTMGYVTRVWVEQENGRDSLYFKLVIYRDDDDEPWVQTFWIYLDVGTTVALAQLQLLRDAMYSRLFASKVPFAVRVHFNFSSSSESTAYVYWLSLIYEDDAYTVQQYFKDFFGHQDFTGWYTWDVPKNPH